MTQKISHYVAKYDMPGYAKGYRVERNCFFGYPCERFPDIFEPVYESPEVPPGIVAFKWSATDFVDRFVDCPALSYELWVTDRINKSKHCAICTIKVDGVEWSVGDKADTAYTNNAAIDKFEYKNGYWWAYFNHECYSKVSLLSKTRKPIVTLQGKDMYEGDKFWHVQDYGKWDIISLIIQKDPNENSSYGPFRACFSSRELAEQYIRDNRPVYPAGLVEELITTIEYFHSMYLKDPAYTYIKSPLDKLKAFKPKP